MNVFLRGERKTESTVSMPAFLDEDFLLSTATARRLYQEHAAPQPIIDYHTHLSAADIASDRRFSSLFEIWLKGDHYKWRAMRADGVAEALCSGDGPITKKLICWAATIRALHGNPLFHWTHLKLQRHFASTNCRIIRSNSKNARVPCSGRASRCGRSWRSSRYRQYSLRMIR